MKNKILGLIEKYKKHYPVWLELWLIRKRWLYPEPRQFTLVNRISENLRMQMSGRTFEYEVKSKMIYEIWEAIEKEWSARNYMPDVTSIKTESTQSFEDLSLIYRISFISRYRPYRSFGYMFELMEELNKIAQSNNQ